MTGHTMRYSRDDDVLCCCEYLNENGERSHLLGLLCDCSEVDDAFDRFIRGDKWHQTQLRNICSVLHDRCRIPWRGGARKIPLDIISPWILVPSLLYLSSWNFWTFLFTHLLVWPTLFWLIYRTCLKEFNPKTKFFYSWSLATTANLLWVYEYQVVGFLSLPKIVSPVENGCLILLIVAVGFALGRVKQEARFHFCNEAEGKKQSKYCKVCRSCIAGKDHHCVWIDECVSDSNLGSFLTFLFLLMATLVHGGLLLLTSACQTSVPIFFNVILVPSRCETYNHNFIGDPYITFYAGCQCLVIASIVSVLFSVKSYQLVVRKPTTT